MTNQGSTFRNAWKKILVLAPFLWPKKDLPLQFRVLFCFLLLAAGRVINLYVPIYSKLIGELKSLCYFKNSLLHESLEKSKSYELHVNLCFLIRVFPLATLRLFSQETL